MFWRIYTTLFGRVVSRLVFFFSHSPSYFPRFAVAGRFAHSVKYATQNVCREEMPRRNKMILPFFFFLLFSLNTRTAQWKHLSRSRNNKIKIIFGHRTLCSACARLTRCTDTTFYFNCFPAQSVGLRMIRAGRWPISIRCRVTSVFKQFFRASKLSSIGWNFSAFTKEIVAELTIAHMNFKLS